MGFFNRTIDATPAIDSTFLMPAQAWHHWYHITGSTYGTWLPGDPRGYRTRHHREHVEGDYKNPPPKGAGTSRHDHAKALLKRPPVVLAPPSRRLACDSMAEALQCHDVQPAAIAVSATHYHILAQFPEDNPRKLTGIAKKRSARALSEQGHIPEGGAWAARSRAHPINDEQHLHTAHNYILRHRYQGAQVWPACKTTE